MKALFTLAALLCLAMPPVAAHSDLDAFMQRVLARRDDNWKKLEQYVLDEREVLRIEYYPTKLFAEDRSRTDRPERDDARRREERAKPLQQEVQRVMNKAALVTLWIDPASHQILKYTFDNVGSALSAISISVNTLPLGWLAQVEELRASMTMGEPFPDVWLPRALDMHFTVALAVGQFDMN